MWEKLLKFVAQTWVDVHELRKEVKIMAQGLDNLTADVQVTKALAAQAVTTIQQQQAAITAKDATIADQAQQIKTLTSQVNAAADADADVQAQDDALKAGTAPLAAVLGVVAPASTDAIAPAAPAAPSA